MLKAFFSQKSPKAHDFERKKSQTPILLLTEKILHHLGCIKPCTKWDELTTSTG